VNGLLLKWRPEEGQGEEEGEVGDRAVEMVGWEAVAEEAAVDGDAEVDETEAAAEEDGVFVAVEVSICSGCLRASKWEPTVCWCGCCRRRNSAPKTKA